MIGRVIFSLVGIGIGLLLMIKARRIVERITGPLLFAEKYFGGGGTYNFYRFLGVTIIVVCMLIMVGAADFIYEAIVQGLSGTVPSTSN
jgi:hypothetical protein